MNEQIGTATYSPEDNKLRLYPFARLPREIYDRVKAAGFSWAPKQELFVAPMWTPEREDLLCELCGDVGDEDKSLVERAEERAERFEDYSDKREQDAELARQGVAAIADNIPFSQPILVGHHSERRARKDAERIENGMRKAVKLWETSKYWEQRAAGALRHAKYKELPAVRARRIKTIEADQRRRQRQLDEATEAHVFWLRPDLTHTEAVKYAGSMRSDFTMPKKEGDRPDFDLRPSPYDALTNAHPTLYAPRTLAEVVERAARVYPGRIEYLSRWILHYENRLTYEKAMLAEQGASDLIAPKERPKQLPLLNYRSPTKTIRASRWSRELQDFPQVEMTSEDYKRIYSEQRGTLTVDGSHRVRFAFVEFVNGKPARFANHTTGKWSAVFLTDSKAHPIPTVTAPTDAEKLSALAAARRKFPSRPTTSDRPQQPDDNAAKFDALKATLRAGVQVVSAPQLFPTPPELAKRVVDAADIRPGMRVLEPSAGTGCLLDPMFNADATGALFDPDNSRPVGLLVAVEINPSLAKRLRTTYACADVIEGDFLERNGDLGTFDRIVMNPPFENGSDIRHIQHALHMLKPGGRLVAICANGPRQQEKLQPLATSWEPLPAGTFAEQGTNVNTVLAVFEM
jgi:SAM-dependent methyltransferase